jgi:hypothetical protein
MFFPMILIAGPAAATFGYVVWGLRHDRLEREAAAAHAEVPRAGEIL